MTRKNDGTATIAVGWTRSIISKTSSEDAPDAHDRAAEFAQALPISQARDETTVQRHGHQHGVARVNPAHSNEIFSFTAEPLQSASVSIHSSGLPVVPLVVTIRQCAFARHAEKIQVAFGQDGFVHRRQILEARNILTAAK
jgi:hypothetical protein